MAAPSEAENVATINEYVFCRQYFLASMASSSFLR